MCTRITSRGSRVDSLPSRWIRVLALSLTLVGASTGISNIRELDVTDGATDQQRIQSIRLNNGWMVFAWEDQSGGDSEIRYRVFDPNNSQFATIRTAHADSAGDQVDPVITPLFNGGFAIAFASRPVGGDYDVKFRRFDFTGAALDVADMSVNLLGSSAIASGDQTHVQVGTFPEGGWMAAFEDRQTGELHGIRFSNGGAPYKDPQGAAEDDYYFELNAATANEQFEPSLAAFGDEQFATAFNSDTDGTASGRRVRLRIFDSGGPVTSDIPVGSTTERSQDPHVALISDTRMAVAWKTLENTGGGPVWSIYAQVFDLNGVPQGAPLFLHADQSLDRGRPYVIPWSDGGFAVSWETGGAGGSVAARTVAPTNVSPGVMSVFLSGDPDSLNYQISFLGFPGECYELQAADALNNWTTILTTNAPAGSFVYSDLDGATTPYRFFQVKRKLSGNLNP